MKEIDFKLDDWGILSMGMAWTELHCPFCGKYNSNNFIWEFEPDKTSYTGNPCHSCGKQLKVNISIELNNAIFKKIKDNHIRIALKCGNKTISEKEEENMKLSKFW